MFKNDLRSAAGIFKKNFLMLKLYPLGAYCLVFTTDTHLFFGIFCLFACLLYLYKTGLLLLLHREKKNNMCVRKFTKF